MALTPSLQRALDAAELSQAAAQKAEWSKRVQAICELVDPPLTPRELSLGLGLEVGPRGSTVGRWLSTAPPAAKARCSHGRETTKWVRAA